MKNCPECKESYPDAQRYCLTDGVLLSLPDPFHLVGRTLLDKYRIEALIGIGGMGAVYGAHHINLNRRVAFKILLPNLAVGNAEILALFEREARTAGQLNHENVVDIKDAGRTPDNIAYIVMEWLEGQTLEDEITRHGKLTLERTAKILKQIASALEAAHQRGIVHRDLKPSNVMLLKKADGTEKVKVVDFGIAKVISETSGSSVSRAMGTPEYASPEQFLVGGLLDKRSDIYSLGILLYRMLSGKCPFDNRPIQELMCPQLQEPPPLLREVCPEAPVALERLIDGMLAKDPAQRPQRAGEVATLFDRAIGLSGKAQASKSALDPTIIIGATTRIEAQPLEAPDSQPSEDLKESHLAGLDPPHITKWRILALSLLVAIVGVVTVLSFIDRGEGYPIVKPSHIPIPPTTTTPAPVEVMRYKLGVHSKRLSQERPQSPSVALLAGQSFKFHFTPTGTGHLYIIGPDDHQNPMTFLTAQPIGPSGVKTNKVNAGVDFSFPGGTYNWIVPAQDEVYTVIFSREPLQSPAFLSTGAGRRLTPDEQQELCRMRNQTSASFRIVQSENDEVESIVEATEGRDPVIFNVQIKFGSNKKGATIERQSWLDCLALPL